MPTTPATIEKRQDELNRLYAELFGNPTRATDTTSELKHDPTTTLNLSDAELIDRAMKAKNGAKFKALWNGDTSGHGNDDSAADLALCEILAFWTNKDHDQIDALFRQSGLMRDKWDQRRGEQTYGDLTISKAIERVNETYKGKKKNTISKEQQKKSTAATKEKTPNPDDEKLIDELNKKHAVVMVGGKCAVLNEVHNYELDRPDITFSTPTDTKNFYSNVFTSDEIKLGKFWFEHPRRRQYDGITFAPLKDTPKHYNLWKGFSVKPNSDTSLCAPYLEHLAKNSTKESSENFNYLIAWMANLVQNPCDKPGTSVVFRGNQGTGKGVSISEFGKLFGPHYVYLSQGKHLTGNFNAHLKDALIVYADEAFWAGDKSAEGVLKAMITEEYMQIEPKGKDSFQIRNYIRLMISSNNDWVVPAGFKERRFFILDMGEYHIQDREYFKTIVDCMNNGGRGALLYFLQHYDLSNIDLGKIPQTEALFEHKLLSMNPIEQFVFLRLKEGKQTHDVIDWDAANVPKLDFYQEFAAFCGKRSYVPSQIEFGITLKKLIPLKADKRMSTGDRLMCYNFPSLKECREYWEKITNSEGYKWEESEESEEKDPPF